MLIQWPAPLGKTQDRFVTTTELRKVYTTWKALVQEYRKSSFRLKMARETIIKTLVVCRLSQIDHILFHESLFLYALRLSQTDDHFGTEAQEAFSIKALISCPICYKFMSNVIVW